MSRYWFEKRVVAYYGLVIWPVNWKGWVATALTMLPAVSMALVWWRWPDTIPSYLGWALTLSWPAWIVWYLLSLALAVFLFKKIDPGPGWFAGWEKEKRMRPIKYLRELVRGRNCND